MLSALLVLASLAPAQEPLYRYPRVDDVPYIGTADFDLDGVADFYGSLSVNLSDGAFGIKATIETSPFSADHAVPIDMNGDGFPDVVEVNANQSQARVVLLDTVLRESSLQTVSGLAGPTRVAGGDVDGDGANDAVTGGSNGFFFLLTGDGAGGATASQQFTLGARTLAVQLGDLNGDGRADLLASVEPGDVHVALAAGGELGAPSPVATSRPVRDLALADVDLDGALDLAGAAEDGSLLLLGDGAGGLVEHASATFTHTVQLPEIQVVDFDASGQLDLVVGDGEACDGGRLLVAYGGGGGALAATEEVELHVPHTGFSVCDLDGDGDDDLAIGMGFPSFFIPGSSLCPTPGFAEHVILVEREVGGLELATAVTPPARDFALTDVNGDGDLDAAIVDGGALRTFENDGGGGFLPGVTRATSFEGEGVLASDLNVDGAVDLAAFADGSKAGVFGVFAGDGAGGFAPELLLPLEGSGASSFYGIRAAFADWTGDGLPDLMTPAPDEELYRLYPGQPDFGFGPASLLQPTGADLFSLRLGGVEPLDVDLDGDLDAVVQVGFDGLFTGAPHLRTATGDGNGTLVQTQSLILTYEDFDLSVASGDFDVDGLPDIVTAQLEWCRGVGDGMFALAGDQNLLLEHAARSADADGDGVDDVVTRRGLFLQGGPGGPAPPTELGAYYSYWTEDTQVADVVGDGAPDLVVLESAVGVVALEARLGCSGSFEAYAGGCAGASGDAPLLEGAGCPTPGGVYELQVARGPAGTAAFASFGLGQGALALPNGCELLLSPWIPVFVGFTLDASGAGSLPIAVSPTAPTGVTSTAQVGLFDPGAPDFYTLSNGLAIAVQ
ncbi:MAG: VCBS repeat-containing protein [Planctomycetota bacterium]